MSSGPIQGGRDEGKESPRVQRRESAGDLAGRSVTPSDQETAELLGLSVEEYLALSNNQGLTREQSQAALLAQPLFREDMPPLHRLKIIELVAEHGKPFVDLLLPLINEWEDSAPIYRIIVALAQESEKWPYIRHYCPENPSIELIDFILNTDISTLDKVLDGAQRLCQFPADLDRLAIELTKVKDIDRVCKAVMILQHVDDTCADRLHLVHYANTLSDEFFALLEKAESLFHTRLSREEIAHLLHLIRDLSPKQSEEIIPFVAEHLGLAVPPTALFGFIERLKKGMDREEALDHFIHESFSQIPYLLQSRHVAIEEGDFLEVLERLADLFCTKRVILQYQDSAQDRTLSILRSHLPQLRSHFAPILEELPNGSLRFKQEGLDLEKAEAFGTLLFLLVAHDIHLPQELTLDHSVYEDLAQADIYEESILGRVASGLSHGGDLRLHPNLLKKLHPLSGGVGRLVRRVSDHGEKLLLQRGCSKQEILLFGSDREIAQADKIQTAFRNVENPEEAFAKAVPLFTDQDSATTRIQLIQAAASLSREQVQEAARLVLDGDSVHIRISILRAFPLDHTVPENLPLTLEDTLPDRLLLVRQFADNPEALAVALQLPNLGKYRPLDRYHLCQHLARLHLAPPHLSKMAGIFAQSKSQHWLKIASLLQGAPPKFYEQDAALIQEVLVVAFHLRDPQTFLQLAMKAEPLDATLRFIQKCRPDHRPDVIAALSVMDNRARNCLIQHLQNFNPHPAIFALATHSEEELRTIFERAYTFFNGPATEDEILSLWALLGRIPLAGHADALATIKSMLRPDSYLNDRPIVLHTLASCSTPAEVHTACCALARHNERILYDDLRWAAEPFPIAEPPNRLGPFLPTLLPYIRNPLAQAMYVGEGEAQDAGGPSGTRLAQASTELEVHYADHWQRNANGFFQIPLSTGGLQPAAQREAASLGRFFYLMLIHGVSCPEDMLIDEESFDQLAALPTSLMQWNSLDHYLNHIERENRDTSEDLAAFQKAFLHDLEELYKAVFAYEIQKFDIQDVRAFLDPDDDDEFRTLLIQEIRSKERLFQIARGLSHEGQIPIRPIMRTMLNPRPNLRAILSEPSSWDFHELSGDVELQKSYFARWVEQASDEDLIALVSSLTGLETLPPGRRIKIKNSNVDGPFPHTCLDFMDMPPMPLEGQTEAPTYHLRQWEAWKELMDHLPQDYTRA